MLTNNATKHKLATSLDLEACLTVMEVGVVIAVDSSARTWITV